MDSIETEEYERMMKEEDEKNNKQNLEVLNKLAKSINERLYAARNEEDDNYYIYLFEDFELNQVVVKGNIYTIVGFLKGYQFAKSSLPF